MAKGQKRSNRELKKPKQKKEKAAMGKTGGYKDAPLSIGSAKKDTQK